VIESGRLDGGITEVRGHCGRAGNTPLQRKITARLFLSTILLVAVVPDAEVTHDRGAEYMGVRNNSAHRSLTIQPAKTRQVGDAAEVIERVILVIIIERVTPGQVILA